MSRTNENDDWVDVPVLLYPNCTGIPPYEAPPPGINGRCFIEVEYFKNIDWDELEKYIKALPIPKKMPS